MPGGKAPSHEASVASLWTKGIHFVYLMCTLSVGMRPQLSPLREAMPRSAGIRDSTRSNDAGS